MSPDPITAQKDALLEAMLPNVVFDGWTEKALHQAARETGLGAEDLAALLPGGARELARWLDDWADRRMLLALAEEGTEGLRTRQRIIRAVQVRLELLAPYKEAVRRAITQKLSPFGLGHAAQAVSRTVDAIWYWAGDVSADFNYYTKRGLLAAVYGATVLYWLDDASEGSAATWDFLERRIAEVLKLPAATGQFRQQARRAALHFAGPFLYLRQRAGR
jgi:ubiquinone biosynthesis protein COQ9